jgi:hypothetical protein
MIIIYTFFNSPGFGDNLRGFISLLQICNKINYRQKNNKLKYQLFVDFSKSKIDKYLIYKLPLELLEISKNIEVKSFYYCNEENHEKEIIDFLVNCKDNLIRITTNNFPDENNINDDMKNYVKNLFKFNSEFENKMNEYLKILPEKYNLYHYRFGDTILLDMTKGEDEINTLINSFNKIENKKNSVIISDSLVFKQKIYEIYKNNEVFVFLTKPAHTGYDNPDSDDDINIFIDFMLIKKAQSLNCYSIYGWISNFILWTSHIYNVPLKNLK